MKSYRLKLFGAVLFLLALAAGGGILWLGNASIAPPVETVKQVLPDDRIPR